VAKTNGNVQDISVHDKDVAALAATREAQDMSRLNRVTVPMPAFVNPNNPETASGSVNLSLAKTPVSHSEDYGVGRGSHVRLSAADIGVGEAESDDLDTGATGVEYPENRDDWGKKHWQSQAREYGLPVSGNMDEVKERVEEHEGAIDAAKEYRAEDWKAEIESAETTDDLDELQTLYEQSGVEFSTVETAFEKRRAALTDES